MTLYGIPALVLLISFPGLGGWFKKTEPAPADSLPPPWTSASRLALESQFVRAALPTMGRPGELRMPQQYENRQLHMGFDADSAEVLFYTQFGETRIGVPARASLEEYSAGLTRDNFTRMWQEKNRQNINNLGANTPAASRGGLQFALPDVLPRQVQSILGPGGPALNVSGSERITLSGQSNWTNQQVTQLGVSRSLFPTLDMQQDLDIRLEGQLSDRIKVNLLQNSANTIPLANRIAINYKGDEDDLVQALDLGNTNLTLPGTQYVSYSGRNEGLFGVKATTRVGPLDWTILATKQEGRSERAAYAGGSSKQDQQLRDLDYVKGVYFFLYDPNGFTLDIPDSTIRVYLDDDLFTNNVNTVSGLALVEPNSGDTTSVRGTFNLLERGSDKDYEVLTNFYGPNFKVIRMRRPVTGQQRLAVSYLASPVNPDGTSRREYFTVGGQDTLDSAGRLVRRMKAIRVQADSLRPAPSGPGFDPNSPFLPTRELELRNVYQLGGSRIDPGSFTLTIRKGSTVPPRTTIEPPSGGTVPYIEVLGLDNFDETGGFPDTTGHDGRVDGTRAQSNTRIAVDFENGTLFFYDARPFAPRLVGPNAKSWDQRLDLNLRRRARLLNPDREADDGQNPGIYDNHYVNLATDVEYFIDVEFTASRVGGEITLGRGNIIDGSEVVTINGQAQTRGRDYEIDYDLGRVTLKKQLGPTDNLNVDYAYAPLFQQAGRTLVGSAFRLEGRDKSFGGAFMYESRGAQDVRPRLGEEPSRAVIGDLNTEWTFRPNWITRLVDRLPGVRTTTPSEMHVQAEVGMSFPNPNTRNEVFIDDMEGVRDAISVSMGIERWRLTSVPAPVGSNEFDQLVDSNAEIKWYSPPSSVKERDLKPNLTDAEGGNNSRQVLGLSIPRRPLTQPNPTLPLWAGLIYPLDPNGLDLTRAQFIELWVNDFNDRHRGASTPEPRVRGLGVKLHIDLGSMSEDQMPAPNVPPNGLLDTEDQVPRDGQLDITDIKDEDTGLDGRKNEGLGIRGVLYDLTTASSPGDSTGDNWGNVIDDLNDIDPRRYRFTNGTEGNRTLLPIPDTEELIPDDILNDREDYFRYTIDLSDSTYLITDVQRDYPEYPVAPDNGWRRYRIPISDSLAQRIGSPNLAATRAVRVWLDGIVLPDPLPQETESGVVRPLVMLGQLDIVGSRWQTVDLTADQRATSTTVTLTSINTLDNDDEYEPPFDPGSTRSGNQELERREQSLVLEFKELQPDDSLEAFKTFSLNEDYSRYGALDWYVAGFEVPGYVHGVDSLNYFIRFASDENGRDYYEYRAPLPPSSSRNAIAWSEVKLVLTDISNLKLNVDFPKVEPILYRAPGPQPGIEYVIKGRPSFTRIRRISFGLINRSGRAFPEGQLWFNELRAVDVAKDVGRAQRLLVNGRMANLLSYNVNWTGRDADFVTVGETRGTGNSTDQLSASTSIDLHRFYEGTGIITPVALSYTRNSSTPRFTAGDDVVRTGPLAEASETRSETRTISTQYSRAWSDRSSALLRYTLGGITGGINRSEARTTNPNFIDTTTSVSANVNYNIAPRRLMPVALPLTKAKLYPLPERFYWNYGVNTSRQLTYDRLRDSSGTLVLRNNLRGRTAFIDFGGDFRPVDMFHQHFEARRNLTLDDELREEFGFINLGRVVMWRQNMDARYTVNLGSWLKPSLSWNSNFLQNGGPELSRDLSVRQIANGQSGSANWELPFDRLASRTPQPVVADSAARRRIHIPSVRHLLSRLGAVSVDGGYTQTSSYSRISGSPSFPYLVGLSSDPGFADTSGRVAPLFGNDAVRTADWRTGARSRILLLFGSSLNTRFDYSTRKNTVNTITNRAATLRFPDVDMDYGNLPRAFLLDRVLNNPRLRTAYNRSVVRDWVNNSDSETSVSSSSEWRPLLGLTGDLKSGWRTDFRFERRVTKRENRQLGSSITTDRTTDVNLGFSRSYAQGQKVSFLGRESTVRSSITVGTTAVYSRRSGETVDARFERPQNVVSEDRLSVNATGSYSFSSNVTGNASIGFGQNRDIQRDVTRRNVRVELRAQFTF